MYINKLNKDLAFQKRELEEKIKLADIFMKYSLRIGKEMKAFGIAGILRTHGITQYKKYLEGFRRENIISRIESMKNIEDYKGILSQIFQIGLNGSKSMRVFTYNKGTLLLHQRAWRRELETLSTLPKRASQHSEECLSRWHPETIEKVLGLLRKLVACKILYIHGLEVIRSHYSSNAYDFLHAKNLLMFKGGVKHVTKEILELSKHGYTAMTGVIPRRIPPNAKVWEVQLDKIMRDFPLLEKEIRSRG